MDFNGFHRSYFLPNLVACIPPQLIEALAASEVFGGADLLEAGTSLPTSTKPHRSHMVGDLRLTKAAMGHICIYYYYIPILKCT